MTFFLGGDVMTGRGIDQVLPHPGNPTLHEPWIKSASGYVDLAERASGPIPRPVSFPYLWGDALGVLERAKPDVRLVNLETSITRSDQYWKGKDIHYRMHPDNAPCLAAARIDVCALANNHVLDWGYGGLAETLQSLNRVGIRSAGAGSDFREAAAPAVIESKRRVLVFSFGLRSSGIPRDWAAAGGKPGIHLLAGPSAARSIADRLGGIKQPGDVAVASIHWGGNWSYPVPREQVALAHALIDHAGIDLIHGHSSHHVKGIEVYRGKLILYGAGELIDDYEGIEGYERYRGDLVAMYFPVIDPENGTLVELRMNPMRIRRFRLNQTSEDDTRWLRDRLDRECRRFGTRVDASADGTMMLRWR